MVVKRTKLMGDTCINNRLALAVNLNLNLNNQDWLDFKIKVKENLMKMI